MCVVSHAFLELFGKLCLRVGVLLELDGDHSGEAWGLRERRVRGRSNRSRVQRQRNLASLFVPESHIVIDIMDIETNIVNKLWLCSNEEGDD